jgi:glycosyltransferase involved in cell wall biosynthesis
MSPKFSIIIPVFNVAPYLRECLDSVLAQTFTDWEAICVDDGSTDESGAILDEYAEKDSRFKVIHQQNAGVSAARNAALGVVRGEWVWFVDSDDSIKPFALDAFVAINNKADVTFISMELRGEDGFSCAYLLKSIDNEEVNEDTSLSLYALMDNSLGIDAFGWTWDKIIRRELICNGCVRFDEEINFFEDELFALKIFQHAQTFSCMKDILYSYRIVNTSLTRSRTWQYFPIAQKFIKEGVSSKYIGLRKIAFKRAFVFMKRAISQAGGLIAAIEIIRNEKKFKFSNMASGRFSIIIRIFSRIFPSIIAGFILWSGFRIISGFRNFCFFCTRRCFK